MEKQKEIKVIGLFTLRTLVTLIGIWIFKLILIALPFIKELTIPEINMPVTSLVNILISFVTVLFIVSYGIGISKYWPMEFPKTPEAGTVITMFVFLIGLVVAYGSLKDLLGVVATGPEPVLILQIVFLLAAIFLLLRAALVAYQSLPKWMISIKESLSEPPK